MEALSSTSASDQLTGDRDRAGRLLDLRGEQPAIESVFSRSRMRPRAVR